MWLRCQSSKNAAGQLVKANEFHPTQFPWDTFGCVRWWTHDASWYNGCITVKMEPWRCRYDHTYLQLICHNLSRLHPQKTYHGTSNWMNTGNLPSSGHLFFQQFPSSTSCHLSDFQRRSSPPGSTGCSTVNPSRPGVLPRPFRGDGLKPDTSSVRRTQPMLCCSNEDSGGFNLGILV